MNKIFNVKGRKEEVSLSKIQDCIDIYKLCQEKHNFSEVSKDNNITIHKAKLMYYRVKVYLLQIQIENIKNDKNLTNNEVIKRVKQLFYKDKRLGKLI